MIRKATMADLAAVTRVNRAAYEPFTARLGRPPGPMLMDHGPRIASGETWVAERDGAVVGVAVIVAEADGMLLENVVVAPAAQGSGIGSALLTFADEHARARGLTRIRLYTNVLMRENIQRYAKRGYIETHRAVVDGYHRVFMAKALRPASSSSAPA